MKNLLDGIQNIIFDFGGVLMDLDKEACVSEFERLGVPQVRDMANSYRQSGILLDLEKGLISVEEFRAGIRALSQQTLSDEQIDGAWHKFLLSVPQNKMDLLLHLKAAGYKTYMLSNTNAIHAPKFLQEYFQTDGSKGDQYFDAYYLSYLLHLAKPEPEIFAYILEDAQLDPKKTLFLDDGPLNCEVAQSFGIQTYCPKDFEDFTPLFGL